MRKRRARRPADGTRAPILVEARPNAHWSLDFVHDQLANGRRFRIPNVADHVTRECLAAIPDTSISGRRVARELTAICDWLRNPDQLSSSHRAKRRNIRRDSSCNWIKVQGHVKMLGGPHVDVSDKNRACNGGISLCPHCSFMA